MGDWTLRPHATLRPPEGPVVFVVMDGVGVAPAGEGNAVRLARTPCLDRLADEALTTTLRAHGTAVGLPSDDDMGNSEVGHNAIGAGRVFDQGAKLVDLAIDSGALFHGDTWRWVTGGGTLHLIGLLSDGNVHSHERHLHALIRAARAGGVARVRVHVLLDGRDVSAQSALIYVDRLEAVFAEAGGDCRIASGGGRMLVTMDRYESDWRVVERGWHAHVLGDARRFPSARAAIETFRAEAPDLIDQWLPPFVVDPPSPIQDGDGVVLFNFRGDRALQISRAFEADDFRPFDRVRRPAVRYAGMMRYDGDAGVPERFLVTPPSIDHTFGELLARGGAAQWACSETQKYGHVTYFWNGNRTGCFDADVETYLEVPSDRVPFEQRPWMKAAEVTDAALAAIASGRHRLCRLNYANGDMVGHTGDLRAAILAVEAVDLCLARLANAVAAAHGVLLVTADHGNADEMLQCDKKTGGLLRGKDGRTVVSTSHSLNPVPLYVTGAPVGWRLRGGGGLSNLAATTLELMGYAAPSEYDPSLLITP